MVRFCRLTDRVLVDRKGEARSANPDDASTAGSNATEARSESRESSVPRAFWIPQSVSEHYR